MDAEQESARVRLAEDTAAFDARESQLRRDQEELRREKRIFMDKHDKWNTEKDHIGKLGLELEKRAQEIDEVSLVSFLVYRKWSILECIRNIYIYNHWRTPREIRHHMTTFCSWKS